MKKLFTLLALAGALTLTACEVPADDEQPVDDPEVVDPDPVKPDDPEEPDPEDPDDTEYSFTVTPLSVELEAAGGQFEITATVTSGASHLTGTPSWISPVSVDGGVYVLNAAANPDRDPRSSTLVFCDDKKNYISVAVSQKGKDVFEISPRSVSLSSEGGEFEITVDCTTSYEVSSVPNWISELSSGDGKNRFLAEANESTEPRSGIIVFCDALGTCLPLQVQQDPQPAGHLSLMMRFTATWCGWCPRMNNSVHLAMEQYPDKFLHVAVHGSSSDLAFSAANSIMNQYGITGFPTGIVDGRTEIVNYTSDIASVNIINACKETEETYGTKTGITIGSTLTGRKLDTEVKVYVNTPGDYKITVLLLEDGIINEQSDYEQSVTHPDYVHDDVARIAVTNVLGEAFSVSSAGVKSFQYTVNSIPVTYNLANMRVLVYVQAAFGAQQRIQSGNYGDYYVDNCATAPLGQ